MPVRTFNGTSDNIRCAIGACNVGFGTFVSLCRPTKNKEANILTLHNKAGSAATLDLWLNEEKLAFYNGASVLNSSIRVGTADGWQLLAWSKATGTVKPKFYRYSFSKAEWTIVEGTTALANGSSVAEGTVRIGEFTGAEFFKGDIAISGIWSTALSEAEIKALVSVKALSEWKALFSPSGIWEFKQQAPVIEEVIEEVIDATGNGANQSSRSGTTVTAEEPPIPFIASNSLAMVV